MTAERTILLVVHTGRDEATEVARRVEKVLGDNGIGLKVLSAEAVDRGPLHLAPDDMRALGVDIEVVDADERAAEGLRTGAGARRGRHVPAGGRARLAMSRSRCSESIWAASDSWRKPRPRPSITFSNVSSSVITASRNG